MGNFRHCEMMTVVANPSWHNSMNSKMIAAFIKEKRENAGWSQTELAQKSSLSLRSITALESGESVRKATIQKAVKALGYELVISYDFRKVENE